MLSFYEHTLPVILGEYSGLESLDSLVVGCLSIFKTANHFSEEAVLFTFPTAVNECFHFSMSPVPGVNSLLNV